jgi:leucyl/phenylalanyl-tRNA--protein transferase
MITATDWRDPWDQIQLGEGLGVPVAIGGELTPEAVAGAHRRAIFCQPRSDARYIAQSESLYAPDVAAGDIPLLPSNANPYRLLWWSPAVRYVIHSGTLRLGRSARRSIRCADWITTVDADFDGVMAGCRGNREPTWITDELIRALKGLAHIGLVHTVEVWEGSELIGGVFGFTAGCVLIMESTFHRRPDAAKAAIADMIVRASEVGYRFFDTEVKSDYTMRMGAEPVRRSDYLALLCDNTSVGSLADEARGVSYLLGRVSG